LEENSGVLEIAVGPEPLLNVFCLTSWVLWKARLIGKQKEVPKLLLISQSTLKKKGPRKTGPFQS
jgi:hypothetical protein